MIRFAAFARLVLGLAAASGAQSLSLTGTVRNMTGQPIAGATVRFKAIGNTAVTDAQGHYGFAGVSVRGAAARPLAPVPALRNGALVLSLAAPAAVSLAAFSMQGRSLGAPIDARFRAGEAVIPLARAGAGSSGVGLVLLRLRVGGSETWLKALTQGGNGAVTLLGASPGPSSLIDPLAAAPIDQATASGAPIDGAAADPLPKAAAGDSLFVSHPSYHGGLAHIDAKAIASYAGVQDFRLFSTDPAWKTQCAVPVAFNYDNSAGVARYKALIKDPPATEQEVLMEVCQAIFRLPTEPKKYSAYTAEIKASDGVAATAANTLYFNTAYIASQPDTYAGWYEVVGVQVHEAVHSYQPYYNVGSTCFGEAGPDAVRALTGFFQWKGKAAANVTYNDCYQDGGRFWYYIETRVKPGFLYEVWKIAAGDMASKVKAVTGMDIAALWSQYQAAGL